MWFAYMDETGNTGQNLKDSAQPIHMILTVAIEETCVSLAHEHIRETAQRHCPTTCKEDDFEFHGQDIFSGDAHFAGLSPTERIAIFDDVLRGLELIDARVIVRGVHKPSLDRRYAKPFHPHDIALMFTIEEIERMARDMDCRVLLVADEAKEIEDAALRDLAYYQEVGTSWGWQPERIDCIIDTIHFVPSHRNPGIQLTDCATFIAARVEKIRAGLVDKGPSAEAVEALWEERVAPFIHRHSVWYPT
jgi:hypothetical protein